jgi:hypothetical protein
MVLQETLERRFSQGQLSRISQDAVRSVVVLACDTTERFKTLTVK